MPQNNKTVISNDIFTLSKKKKSKKKIFFCAP